MWIMCDAFMHGDSPFITGGGAHSFSFPTADAYSGWPKKTAYR